MVLALSTLSCQPPPVPLAVGGIEATVRRALESIDSPDRREEVRIALDRALVATAGEASRRGGGGTADIAWERAVRVAWEARRESRQRHEAELQRWSVARRQAQERLAAARAAAGELTDRGVWRSLATAEGALTRAERRAENGDLAGAVEEGYRAAQVAERAAATWWEVEARFRRPDLRQQWKHWAEETVQSSRQGGRYALLVDKRRRRLEVWEEGRLVARHSVELGVRGLERKLRAGDRATPEGRYWVTEVKVGGASRYYKALLLSYPNDDDRQRLALALRSGLVPAGSRSGGLIEIHGHGGRGRDWTNGCVAVADSVMDLLVARARVGTPVTIVGTVP